MITIKGICYIIAACKDFAEKIEFSPDKNDIVIAADGGYDILTETQIIPDILLGDFDSIEKVPEHKEIIKHPSEKDDTDTFLAYKLGFEKEYRNFVIFGGIGGRIDHTVANIRTLSDIAENGGRGFLIGNDAVLTVIKDKIEFPKNSNGYISIFSNQKDTVVTEKGLKYTLKNALLSPSTTLGTSNEFVGERAQISVKNGSLLVVWYENQKKFLKNLNYYTKKNFD